MQETNAIVSVSELKNLLFSIVENHLQVSIRYRLIGQLWHPNFLRIIKITEGSGVLFEDETSQRQIAVSNLSTIIQFELDGRLYAFEPYFHYEVTANENLEIKNAENNSHLPGN